jgi:MORN repeat protein
MHAERFLATNLLALALVGVPARGPAQAGDWSVDTAVTCRVWNPHPQVGETIKWSGTCVNGFAQGAGSVRWFKNNLPFETDEGEWREGYQIGKGKQAWPSGSYEGEFADSEPNGRGVFVLQGMQYEGEFRHGKPNGTGTLSGPKGTFAGNWTDGCLRNGTQKTSFGVPLSACP